MLSPARSSRPVARSRQLRYVRVLGTSVDRAAYRSVLVLRAEGHHRIRLLELRAARVVNARRVRRRRRRGRLLHAALRLGGGSACGNERLAPGWWGFERYGKRPRKRRLRHLRRGYIVKLPGEYIAHLAQVHFKIGLRVCCRHCQLLNSSMHACFAGGAVRVCGA